MELGYNVAFPWEVLSLCVQGLFSLYSQIVLWLHRSCASPFYFDLLVFVALVN